jgi:50S ribosomal protein L16 3-hydroxylase
MQLLGGLSAKHFLSRFWQKKPLLIRNAIPGSRGIIQAPELFRLAGRGDVESRIVRRRGRRWALEHGPFSRADIDRQRETNWTLLVQGVNLFHPPADALLRRFDFIPYARLDDVMVSYAAPGGGVGPHVDSYDVFLLQGAGRRRWRLSAKTLREFDRRLDPGAPLRILRRFRPAAEWVLEPGDMLYLPPGWGHEGTALDACITCSIGFRAPSRTELAAEFLAWLGERADLPGLYADPGLRPAANPAELPRGLVRAAAGAVRALRWGERDLTSFVGSYLTAPKARVAFRAPRRPLARARFARRCRDAGVALDARSQLLFRGRSFFVNGATLTPPGALAPWLKALAAARRLEPGRRMPAGLCDLLYRWYLSGWVRPGGRHG